MCPPILVMWAQDTYNICMLYIIYIIYYMYIYIATQSAQFSWKQVGYNTYVIIVRLSLKQLCGNLSI